MFLWRRTLIICTIWHLERVQELLPLSWMKSDVPSPTRLEGLALCHCVSSMDTSNFGASYWFVMFVTFASGLYCSSIVVQHCFFQQTSSSTKCLCPVLHFAILLCPFDCTGFCLPSSLKLLTFLDYWTTLISITKWVFESHVLFYTWV